jgi:hypothetical protein
MINNWLECEVRRLFVNLFGGTEESHGKLQTELSAYGKYKNQVFHKYSCNEA